MATARTQAKNAIVNLRNFTFFIVVLFLIKNFIVLLNALLCNCRTKVALQCKLFNYILSETAKTASETTSRNTEKFALALFSVYILLQ
jgi:hypothetical protein